MTEHTAQEALNRLITGNRRFVTGMRNSAHLTSPSRRNELAEDQKPFAIVLGCSDSRVPAEIVFDQGLGNLFVIRVAGNVVAPSQIGSVEFAAELYDTRLVVVMGHSRCGVILATISELEHQEQHPSKNLRSIVGRVRPAVEPLLKTALAGDYDALVEEAVRANVRASVEQLRHGSEILEELIQRGRLLIVGAEYSLETGVVEFLDGVTASADSPADNASAGED